MIDLVKILKYEYGIMDEGDIVEDDDLEEKQEFGFYAAVPPFMEGGAACPALMRK